jgi:hypothetical protein
MQTTIQQQHYTSLPKSGSHSSVIKRFFNWADKQEENRLLWTAIAVAGHGCVFTIITVTTILLTGNNFFFWPFAIAAMAMCLVSNLAAMPTKVTIPLFFISLFIDVVIIVACLTNGFHVDAMYR